MSASSRPTTRRPSTTRRTGRLAITAIVVGVILALLAIFTSVGSVFWGVVALIAAIVWATRTGHSWRRIWAAVTIVVIVLYFWL